MNGFELSEMGKDTCAIRHVYPAVTIYHMYGSWGLSVEIHAYNLTFEWEWEGY